MGGRGVLNRSSATIADGTDWTVVHVQIEQPFAVLPVMSFCTTIRANLTDMIDQAASVRQLAVLPQTPEKRTEAHWQQQ